jgi:uncharacterized Zn ribbon protein
MEISCPNCGSDQAYHDGVQYQCPDCDYEWSDGLDLFDDDEEKQQIRLKEYKATLIDRVVKDKIKVNLN